MTVLLYEWKHFARNPFKLVALALFLIAGVYALHNGADLVATQRSEIDRIQKTLDEKQSEVLGYFEAGKKGPDKRSWENNTMPYWAIQNSPTYRFKNPSPLMVYSIGQAEQFGFYHPAKYWSSPYDAGMTEEIANPERLQSGTLDFSFVILYLLPVLLIIWLYSIKSAETDGGFIRLIEVQTRSPFQWLVLRFAFYFILAVVSILALMVYGALLTDVFAANASGFSTVFLLMVAYTAFWTLLYLILIYFGGGILANSLKLVAAWLLLIFILPAAVHQWVSAVHPPNLMTEFIDARRAKLYDLLGQPSDVLVGKLQHLYPEVENSAATGDKKLRNDAVRWTRAALANELMKASGPPIEEENQKRNQLIRATFWLNPVPCFQNSLNRMTQTHYDDYASYRKEIQNVLDQLLRRLVLDTWNQVEVTKARYLEYVESFSQKNP